MNVLFCLSAVYGSLFLLPPKYCRVRGVHYTRVFWVRRLGSTPLRKLWVQVQRVATSMRQARNSRRSGAKELFVILNFTQRGPSIPCTDPELSTTLVDGPHRRATDAASLAHRPADPPPTARPHPVASPRHRRYLGHIHRGLVPRSGRMGSGAGPGPGSFEPHFRFPGILGDGA